MTNTFVFANNQSTTLGSNASAGAGTLTLATGGGAGLPNPAAGQQFALTLYKAASPPTLEIVYCTARSGDVLTVVRGQEGTTARAWLAGDPLDSRCTAGQMAAFLQQPTVTGARTVLSGNTTFYVNPSTGNDSNNGLSSGTPWLTLQHAVAVLLKSYDMGGYTATVSCAHGTYTAGVYVSQPFVGGRVQFVGDNVTASNCLVSVSSTANGGIFEVISGAILTVTGFKLTSSQAGLNGILAVEGGQVYMGNMDFGALNGGDHMHVNSNGLVNGQGLPYAITGTANNHAYAFGGQINIAAAQITLSGSPTFINYFLLGETTGGIVFCDNLTFVGSTTGPGWFADRFGQIDSDGSLSNITGAGFSTGTPATPNVVSASGGIVS